MRRYRHLSKADRIAIEAMLLDGKGKREIAERIGVAPSTIYREVKRGQYEHLNSDYTTEARYSPDIADRRYRENLKAKGPGLKIGRDRKLADFIEGKIANDGYSPEAALGEIKALGLKFDTTISKTTLYRYIDIGLFLSVTNKDLPIKRRKRRRHKKVRAQSRASAGTSIEKRPKEVESREEFGHWEMDTVVGMRGVSKSSLLVLTERKTRMEIIMGLEEHTTQMVCKSLDELERRYGSLFPLAFKSITVDNGTEFSDCAGMERSSLREGERTKIYYCHPYSSYERGSNEVANRLIRRKAPKGTDLDLKTAEDIKEMEDWINDYPRKIFGFRTARMLFDEEMAELCLAKETGA